MPRIRFLPLLLAVALLLYVPAGAVDSMTASVTPGLAGKTFLVLGDSFTAGYGLVTPEQDWSYLLARARSMTQLNYSISGSTVAAGPRSLYPMVERALTLPPEAEPDFILLQGGSNDYSKGIPLGEPDSGDLQTFLGALTATLDRLAELYPQAALVGFTPWCSDGSVNREGFALQDYTDAMLDVFAARGLPCYDASDRRASGVEMDSEAFRTAYCLRVTDWYHLNPAGHALFAPVIARWLEETLYSATYSDQFYDLAAWRSLGEAVDRLPGILEGTSAHLFSPTRAVDRLTLAVCMYRMAGRPSVQARQLTDVAGDPEGVLAVSWGMEAGLFEAGDRFYPDQTVSREMLAVVLYRYETSYLGRFPQTLSGLGGYPDGSDASTWARTALGWALAEKVLQDRDGLLLPKAAVSRGQLALTLAELWGG